MHPLLDKIYRRALRPFDAAYYRFLADRSGPWVRRLGAGVLAREQRSGRGDVPLSRAKWEEQYGAGQWDFLDRVDEVPRYSLIAGFARTLRPGGSVLDVGCGEGILWDHLPADVGSYLGIDLSATAIERGGARALAGARFEVADAEHYDPGRSFDAIVLNECLYYFHDPAAQAQRYFSMLSPGGVKIVSMFQHRRSRAIARQLQRELPLAESFELGHRKGSWIISLFRQPE